jgi:hypothetical protein
MARAVGKMTSAAQREKGKTKGTLTTNETKSTSQFKGKTVRRIVEANSASKFRRSPNNDKECGLRRILQIHYNEGGFMHESCMGFLSVWLNFHEVQSKRNMSVETSKYLIRIK